MIIALTSPSDPLEKHCETVEEAFEYLRQPFGDKYPKVDRFQVDVVFDKDIILTFVPGS